MLWQGLLLGLWMLVQSPASALEEAFRQGLYGEVLRELEPAFLGGETLGREEYRLLAASYLKLKKFPQAFQAAKEGLSVYPDDPELQEIAEKSHTAWEEELRYRVQEYHRALQLYPRRDAYLLELARAYRDLGFPDSALSFFQAYLAKHPDDFPVRKEWAYALYEAGRYAGAEEQARALLKERPEDLEIRVLLARSLREQGRWREAQEAFRKVLELAPEHEEARAFLSLPSPGGPSAPAISAEERLRKRLQNNPLDQAAREELARLLLRLGRYGEARDHLSFLLAQNPDREDIQHLLEEASLKYRKALRKEVQRLSGLENRTLSQTLELARALSGLHRLEEAFPLYRQYLNARPQDSRVRLEYAQVLAWNGDFLPALRELDQISGAIPDSLRLQIELLRGQIYAWSGRFEEARKRFQWVLSRDPKSMEAWKGLFYTYLWEEDVSNAARVLKELQTIFPGYPLVQTLEVQLADLKHKKDQENRLNLLAKARKALGDGALGWAETLLREHLRFYPQDDPSRYLLGRILAWQGAYEEALEELLPLLARHPKAYPLGRDLALYAGFLEDTLKAERFLRQILALSHASPWPDVATQLCAARAYRNLGKPRKAEEMLQKLLSRMPRARQIQTRLQTLRTQRFYQDQGPFPGAAFQGFLQQDIDSFYRQGIRIGKAFPWRGNSVVDLDLQEWFFRQGRDARRAAVQVRFGLRSRPLPPLLVGLQVRRRAYSENRTTLTAGVSGSYLFPAGIRVEGGGETRDMVDLVNSLTPADSGWKAARIWGDFLIPDLRRFRIAGSFERAWFPDTNGYQVLNLVFLYPLYGKIYGGVRLFSLSFLHESPLYWSPPHYVVRELLLEVQDTLGAGKLIYGGQAGVSVVEEAGASFVKGIGIYLHWTPTDFFSLGLAYSHQQVARPLRPLALFRSLQVGLYLNL